MSRGKLSRIHLPRSWQKLADCTSSHFLKTITILRVVLNTMVPRVCQERSLFLEKESSISNSEGRQSRTSQLHPFLWQNKLFCGNPLPYWQPWREHYSPVTMFAASTLPTTLQFPLTEHKIPSTALRLTRGCSYACLPITPWTNTNYSMENSSAVARTSTCFMSRKGTHIWWYEGTQKYANAGCSSLSE
jgi:hypothetical protein